MHYLSPSIIPGVVEGVARSTPEASLLPTLFVTFHVGPLSRRIAARLLRAAPDDVKAPVMVLDVGVTEPHELIGSAIRECHGNCHDRGFSFSDRAFPLSTELPDTVDGTPFPASGGVQAMEYGREIGTIQAPNIKGPAVSDKSPRQAMSKKSGKSLKEKRAAKHAKSAAKEASAADAVLHDKKH